MFCRTCGESNDDYSIYCCKDGTMLHTDSEKINLIRGDVRFCKECGKSIEAHDLYCSNCSISLYEEKSTPGQEQNIEQRAKPINIKNKGINIKSSITYSLIGFAILLFLGFITSSGINSFVQDVIYDELGIPFNIKIINPMDVALLSNLSNLKLDLTMLNRQSANMELNGTLFVLLLIPFIIFFIIGISKGSKDGKSNTQFNPNDALLMGLFYGLMMSMISLANRGSVNIPIPELSTIEKSFIFFKTIINSGLIAILAYTLGYGAYSKLSKKEYITEHFRKVFDILNIFSISILCFSIISFLFIKFKLDINLGNEFVDLFSYGQIIIYTFLMINLGTLGYNFFNEGSETASLFKNMSPMIDELGSPIAIFLYISMLIPIILFFIYGMRTKKTSHDNMAKNLLYPAIIYSFIVALVAYLVYIKTSGTLLSDFRFFDSFNIEVGVKPISAFFGSFVLSILSTTAGYLLGNAKKGVYVNE